jgi:hypothetical protein
LMARSRQSAQKARVVRILIGSPFGGW